MAIINLLARWLVWGALLGAAGVAQAQHRPKRGQALVARPSSARYYRAPVPRTAYRPARRAPYRYFPSYRAYHNRSPYRPQVYYHRRPAGRLPIATLRPRLAGP